MLEFLVDIILVAFAGKVFQQTFGIPMGTNCAPLLAYIFLYSNEADFIQSLLSTGKKKLASRFNLTYRYLSVFIRSVFHIVFALNGKETVGISVQSHLQVHRWCIVHKQPRIRKLSGPDVSCWTWNQGHHRKHHFWFLPIFSSQGSDPLPSSPPWQI